MDQYQWAVFAAMTERYIQPTSAIYMLPSHGNLHGFTLMDSSHVQWYLAGWEHETYNYRTGRRDGHLLMAPVWGLGFGMCISNP